MSKSYYDVIHLIERLHRHSLDVVKVELDRLNILDINNVQSLILFNIGEDQLTVGELTLRGYYLGSNVSYNVKKMVENGYLVQERSVHDRRSVRVRLSEKGAALRVQLRNMFEKHAKNLVGSVGMSEDELKQTNELLLKLERFWSAQIEYTGTGTAIAAA
ncbi:MAG: MarR family winged helix-turn-helix transcriptional regulator [Alphaproteobacteria bacterium]